MIRIVVAELFELIYRTIIYIQNLHGIIIENREQFAVDIAQEVLLVLEDQMRSPTHRNILQNTVGTQTSET